MLWRLQLLGGVALLAAHLALVSWASSAVLYAGPMPWSFPRPAEVIGVSGLLLPLGGFLVWVNSRTVYLGLDQRTGLSVTGTCVERSVSCLDCTSRATT
jgi:hypothetical protein